MWSSFFHGVQDFFYNFAFIPFDALRSIESWYVSNGVNWTFLTIGAVAFLYWMGQLNGFHKNGEEDKEVTSHPYL